MVARADLQVTLSAIDRASPTIKQLESSIIRFVGAVSASLAALGTIALPIAQATRFDRALRDVQKTTGFADDEIKQLGRDLIELSRGLDQSAQSLAGIAAAAGQLGLGRQGAEAILAFSESVARASTTLDLSTDAAARASAKLLNIFQLDTRQVENLFSTVNELSNTTTANAGELIDTMTRIGNTAQLSAQEVAALAATAIDLGVSAEVAGTSLVKVFSRIQSNAQGFADAIGVSLSEFTALPALDRFQQFLSFLSTQTDEVQANLITKLAGGGRIFALVNKLTTDAGNSFEVLNRNLTTSNTAFDSGLSAITEYQNISKALSVQLGILRNNFSALTISVGQQFIPKLLQITRELIEFLDTPRASAFFRGIGESAREFFDVIVRMVKAVGDLDVEFRNLFAILKAIIALQFGRILLGIGARLAQTLIALTGITRAATIAQGPVGGLFSLFSRSRTAGADFGTAIRIVTTSLTSGLLPALRSIGAILLRFIPLVGIVAAVLSGAFALFGDEIKKVFADILDFFGFVSEEQGKALDEAKEKLDEDIASFEEASATILASRKRLESGALDLPEESFAKIIERDITELNKAVLVAQERIKVLGELSAAAATQSEIFARAAQRFQAAAVARIRGRVDATIDLEGAEKNLARLRERLASEQEVDTVGLGDLTGDRATTLRQIAEAEEEVAKLTEEEAEQQEKIDLLLDVANRKRAQALQLTKDSAAAAEEQAEIFERIVQGLTAPLVDAFRLEIDARQAELELADVQQSLGELRGQLSTAQALGEGDSIEAARLELRILNLADSVAAYEEKARLARLETARFVSGLSAAEEFEFARAIPNLAKTVEGLQATEDSLEALDRAGLQTTSSLEDGFNKVVVSLVQQKLALEDTVAAQGEQKKVLEDLAKAAKSVFDNTATEVRALNRALINSVEEFRIQLARRPLDIKVKVDIAALETELGTIESRREELEARLSEIEELEQGNRLLGTFTFEKNKTKAELDELRIRQAAIEQQQRADEERRLRAEFAAIEARTREFIQRAQELAGEGRLDEALGLKELAKNQIPDLFQQLEELSGLTTGEGRPLVSTDELETLVGQVQGLSREVQEDVAGINDALKTSTEEQLTDFKNTTKVTNERLADVNLELEEMGKNIEGFNKALPAIIKAVSEGTFVTGAGATSRQPTFTPGGVGTGLGNEVASAIDAGRGVAIQERSAEDLTKIRLALEAQALREEQRAQAQEIVSAALANRASGGIVRGRGTGTSDSIPAMLSNGEFVINAATTRFFGSPFFNGLQRFARGGLTVPRFGVGGLVGGVSGFEPVIQAAGAGGAPVNIHLPSGDVVRLREGETDSQGVIRMFKREARKRGTRGA